MAIPTRPSGTKSPISDTPSLATPEHTGQPQFPDAGESAQTAPPWTASARPAPGDDSPSRLEERGGDGAPRDFARFVRETASSQLENQKERATRGLGNVANAVRQTTDELRAAGQDGFAGYVQQAADRIDEFARGLQNKNLDEVMQDVQTFARRHPSLFIGSAFALGLLGGRFLKSSRGRSESRLGSQSAGHRTQAPVFPDTTLAGGVS